MSPHSPSTALAMALSVTVLLTACVSSDGHKHRPGQFGVPNPASAHCEADGGRSEWRVQADGNRYRVCRRPNGEVIDEWELYRRDRTEQTQGA